MENQPVMNDVARQEVLAVKDGLLLTLSYPSDEAFAILKDGKSPEAQRLIDAARVCVEPPPPAKGKSPAECLSEVLGGSKSDYPIHWSERRKKAAEIVDRFFSHLETKGVKLTGDRVTDQPVIEKEWGEYKKAHENEQGIADAEEALDRWFNVAAFYETTSLKIHLKMARDITGFVMIGLLLGIPAVKLMPELKSDNGVLLFLSGLAPGNPLPLDELNKDLAASDPHGDGSFNLQDTVFGMLGQIYYNPFLDSWIKSFPPDERPIAQNVLFLLAGVGAFMTHQHQNDLLEVTWSEQYQPEIKTMVEQLMRYLYVHGDMGLIPQMHRWMPEINGQARGEINILSGIMRGGFAVLLFLNANTNARMYMQGKSQKAVIDGAGLPESSDGEEMPDTGDQSRTFQNTTKALANNDIQKSYPMMMNDALFFADILMQSTQETLEALGKGDSAARYVHPVVASGLSLLLFGLLVAEKVGPAEGLGGSTREYVERYRLNRRPEALEEAINSELDGTANLWMPFIFGSLEALAAGFAEHRHEVVTSFAMVNNMLGRNQFMSRVAAEGKAETERLTAEREAAAGEGEDPKPVQFHSASVAMSTMSWVDVVAALWAGIDAGSTAALADFNTPLDAIELTPAAMGLVIRAVYLYKASQLPDGPGKDAVVLQERIASIGYLGFGLISFGLSKWLGEKIDLEIKYESSSYEIAGNIQPFPGGVGVVGRFGAKSGPSEREQRIARLQREREILASLTARQQALTARLRTESFATDADRKAVRGEREALARSLVDTNREVAGLMSEVARDRAAQVDELLRAGSVPFNPFDKGQRELVAAELLPDLAARKRGLEREVARLDSARLSFVPAGGPGVLTRFQVVPKLLSPGDERRLAGLREELARISRTMADIEKGNGAVMAALYREKTGLDLNLVGFNPVLRRYRDRVEAEGKQFAIIAKVLGAMAKG